MVEYSNLEFSNPFADALVQALSVALKNHDAEKKARTIAISQCSKAEATKLVKCLDVIICDASPEEVAELAEDDLSAYPWRSPIDEKAQSADIVEHLRAHAGTFLNTLGYKLVDTHTSRTCLDFESSTIGKITGGTDAMIVPKRVNAASYGHQACVLFEWKTPTDLEAHFEESVAQAKVELIAARCLSHQPLVSIVLTDMTSRAFIHQFAFNESENKFYIKTMSIKVKQICPYVFNFLQAFAKPSALFTPSADSERAVERALVALKRQKIDGDIPIALEHLLEEMEDDSPENFHHRRALALSYFQSLDPDNVPTILTHPMLYA